MKKSKRTFQSLCLWAGIAFMVAAAALMITWQRGIDTAQRQMAACVDTIRTILPEPQGAAIEPQQDNTMPVLSIDGTDFVGIIELPAHGSALPVCAQWGQTSKHPSRFSGSVYDRSIQIGATSQKGQYDFYRQISVGDELLFTDMTGDRYAYKVTDIRYEKSADRQMLAREEAALILFVKNVYGFEYILFYCNTYD